MRENELLEIAADAASRAYCKYSGFRVGAALLAADGTVYTGCNIENSSYSLTVCAERTAVFKAVSEGNSNFKAIAVVGSSDDDFSKPCPPCGACLQVMSEFCGDDFRIILADKSYTISELMPHRFDSGTLNKSED